jgi:hypothetical protein
MQPHPSFLIILRAFLTRAAEMSPSLSDLRAVLAEIFQAYAFEERILNLANQFLDRDLFEHVDDAWTRRQTGWRPKGNVCEYCSKRVWGPGVGGKVWESWEKNVNREEVEKVARREKIAEDLEAKAATASGKGKAAQSLPSKGTPPDAASSPTVPEIEVSPPTRPLVVFACRHIWHKDCLEKATTAAAKTQGSIQDQTSSGLPTGAPPQEQSARELHCPASHLERDSETLE